ncbi:hypothetical protein MRB53_037825 [Persea americana]|nr:hypothetical protein MRB53_037825 [Persea americana]
MTRRTGDVMIYLYYFATAGWWVVSLYLATACAYVFSVTFPSVWLQWWTNANDDYGTQRVGYWLGVYAALGGLALIMTFASSWVLLMIMVPTTARRFHSYLLQTTMRATTSFLTSTDIGGTTNRFSQDLELVDLDLPQVFETTCLYALTAIAEGVLSFVGSGYVAIAIPGVIAVVYVVQNYYLRTSRQLRFLEIEARGPLFSHFLETLSGLASVRAFGWTNEYRTRNLKALNDSQKPFYLLYTIQRWLTLVLNLTVAGIAILLVGIVTTQRHTATSLLGVALFNIVNFGSTLEQLITEWTQLETSIGAINRIRSYVKTTQSEDLDTETAPLPPSWPERGAISFNDVYASYEGVFGDCSRREDCTLRQDRKASSSEKLKSWLTDHSGKSSLISTLLRMLELDSGRIIIDGNDLSTVSRSHVRERLNTLPQEPFFLHGSVRLNADPQHLADDETIVHALKTVGLWNIFEARGGLDSDLPEEVLSQGQRQLFCLARAMCKPSSILILDEATSRYVLSTRVFAASIHTDRSSVDADTDATMQRIIRSEFQSQTIIAIAHKLHSIVDFDKVAMLDSGRIVEFDNPGKLLETEGSEFKALYESLYPEVMQRDDCHKCCGLGVPLVDCRFSSRHLNLITSLVPDRDSLQDDQATSEMTTVQRLPKAFVPWPKTIDGY